MKVAIIGFGSAAMTVADIVMESHNFHLAGFVGTKEEEEENLRNLKLYRNIPFLGKHSVLPKLKEGDITGFIVAIGDNSIREKTYYEALQADLVPINAVSRNAIINPDVILGKGIVISPGVVLSHGVTIGSNVILDPSVIINVNASISDHCHLRPGTIVCGDVSVGKNVRLGAGCIIESRVKVGKNQIVSSGTVVHESLEGLFREDKGEDN